MTVRGAAVFAVLLLIPACGQHAVGCGPDSIEPPIVLLHRPGNSADLVQDGIYEVLSAELDPSSVDASSVTLSRADVEGMFPVPAESLTAFTNQPHDTVANRPNNPLSQGQYSVTVKESIRSAKGNLMDGPPYVFSFHVGPDHTAPFVVSTSPDAGEKNVDPASEIRITMSETILASTVNVNTITVSYYSERARRPISIPGIWFIDGGNAKGNNFPVLQLDEKGNPGLSGCSPRNGVDLVFRPGIYDFPVNGSFDPNETEWPVLQSEVEFPAGHRITVAFNMVGLGLADIAGNAVDPLSRHLEFSFFTRARAPLD